MFTRATIRLILLQTAQGDGQKSQIFFIILSLRQTQELQGNN